MQEQGRVTLPAAVAELQGRRGAVQARWVYASATDAAKAIVPLVIALRRGLI